MAISPYIGYIGIWGNGLWQVLAWGGVETLTICDDKSVHGCEDKSEMKSVHGCERLCDEVRMKE